MPLDIDASKPLRSASQQREFVKAIVASPRSTQEANWVEWKNVADVRPPKWRAELSRHVLGFANRDPASAATWMEGCAYIVVGASPEALTGTAVHDDEKLEDWLAEYVGLGPKGPVWSADYCTVEEKHVLVITIEAPINGHPIWTFRKGYSGDDRGVTDDGERIKPIKSGTIFIRRMAKTETANPDEVEMLTQRACATGSGIADLKLLIHPDSRAVAIDRGIVVTSAWEKVERGALAVRPRIPPPPVARRPTDKDKRLSEAISSLSAASNAASTVGLAGMLQDGRSRQEFDEEVERYIAKGAKTLRDVLVAGAMRLRLGRLFIGLRNGTTKNLSQVQVELTFGTSGVEAYFDGDLAYVEMPPRPEKFGTARPFARVGLSSNVMAGLRVPGYSINPAIGRRARIDNSHSATITFEPVDLYPKQTEVLDTVYLITEPEHAGTTLTGTWTAVAKNLDGVDDGTLDVPVSPDIPTEERLRAAQEDDDS